MSVSRQRQQKRRAARSPAVWRGAVTSAARQTVEHGVRGEVGWRMFSGLIVVALVIALLVFFVSDVFYVRSVAVSGAEYLSESEIFRYAGIAEMHVFWVDPEAVRDAIRESPLVADARVIVGWPPNMVRIVVEEREPALIWVQSGVTALIDLQGNILRFPPDSETLPDLLRVIAEGMDGPPGVDSPISSEAINGALQLRNLLAGVRTLRYTQADGLGWREPGGWDVWLGVGTDMPNKLRIYDALRDDLLARGITPNEINVGNPEAVYYCAVVEGC
ncbi:MAG: hypothetical protein OHK0046_33090 [Anaerolineae bacterium]